ncbi:MAG TPA: SIR2 family protein [Frankiaceae bacterium]|jgi:hypothetical protein|nr:SIR2 family protein [Frankiaceae bacterium]
MAADPVNALDPRIALATGVYAKPGVYALLIGSGVSTGAGIPTAWGVVRELVRRAAAVAAPEDPKAAAAAAAEPEAWWAEHGDGQSLGYSDLLTALAPTPGARRGLLTSFFEPSQEDLENGSKVPGPAHRAIATLVKRGLVRVIMTTNFDRLIERALEDVGVPPQVLTHAEQIDGLTPLAHAPVTVIKLHGDYADLEMRNTVDELGSYPVELDALLDRVLDEYGLVVCGWSADWDPALVAALRRGRSRRYPLYWDGRSATSANAQEVLARHGGVIVPATSADEMFTGLVTRIEALDRLVEAPLSTAIAVARLKRYLLDPIRRIDLYDLVMDLVDDLAAKTMARSANGSNVTYQLLDDAYSEMLSQSTPLLALLVAGVWHDRDQFHSDIWAEAIQRLLRARTIKDGAYNVALDRARHYPRCLRSGRSGLSPRPLVVTTSSSVSSPNRHGATSARIASVPRGMSCTSTPWPILSGSSLSHAGTERRITTQRVGCCATTYGMSFDRYFRTTATTGGPATGTNTASHCSSASAPTVYTTCNPASSSAS